MRLTQMLEKGIIISVQVLLTVPQLMILGMALLCAGKQLLDDL